MKKTLWIIKLILLMLIIMLCEGCANYNPSFDEYDKIVDVEINTTLTCKNKEDFYNSTSNFDSKNNLGQPNKIEDELVLHEMDLSQFDVIEYYDFETSILPLLNNQGIEINANDYDTYMLIDGFVFLSYYTEPSAMECDSYINLQVFSNKGNFIINDFTYIGCPYYFMYENKLCIYDYFLSNGIEHCCYFEYGMEDGGKIGEYIELYDIGRWNEQPYEIICYNFSFTSFLEVEEYILKMTNRLYMRKYF